jgi:hypothetical protein
MATSAAHGQSQSRSQDRHRLEGRTRTVVAIAAGVIAATGLAAIVWLRGPDREQAAIGGLAPQERRALYERTLSTLQSTCASSKGSTGLDDFCRDQAEFIVKFPECNASCAALAGKFRGIPTR